MRACFSCFIVLFTTITFNTGISFAWDPWTLSPVINFYTTQPETKISTGHGSEQFVGQDRNKLPHLNNLSREQLKAIKVFGNNPDNIVKAFIPGTSYTAPNEDIEPDVIEKVMIGVMKAETNIVLLTGDSGVGKKAVANNIATRFAKNKVPPSLQGYRVLVTDSTRLIGGAINRGEFEDRVNKLIEIAGNKKTILLIPGFTSLRGKGAHAGDSSDFFSMIEPALGGKNLKILGFATQDALVNAFSGAPDVLDYIDEIHLAEPQGKPLIKKLKSWILYHYSTQGISSKIIEYAVKISNQLDAVGSQPKKSQLLLGDAISKLAYLGQAPESISLSDINDAAVKRYKADPNFFDPEIRKKQNKQLREQLPQIILGQGEALDAIINEHANIAANVHDPNYVRMGALLVGDSGVGKTETVKTIAKILNLPYKRIMMSKYATSEGGDIEILKQDIHKALSVNAQTLLFFDEVEKAPLFIQNGLLDLFDEGRFTVQYETDQTARHKKSVTVNVRNATVFLATNAGQNFLKQQNITNQIGFINTDSPSDINIEQLKQAMINDNLAKALIDRLRLIVPYKFLEKSVFLNVVLFHLSKTIDEFESSNPGVQIHFSAADRQLFVDTLAPKYYVKTGSNRVLFQFLNNEFLPPLRDAILNTNSGANSYKISFDSDSNKLKVTPQTVKPKNENTICGKSLDLGF